MTPIKDFAVSSAATGFDEFLKVLNEQNGTRWKGNKMFYGIVDNCAWTSSKKWGKELTPYEAIALLTGKQLTEGDLIVDDLKVGVEIKWIDVEKSKKAVFDERKIRMAFKDFIEDVPNGTAREFFRFLIELSYDEQPPIK